MAATTPVIYDSGSIQNYTLGGTRLYFSRLITAPSTYDEYYDLGNIQTGTIAPTIDSLQHFTAKQGARVQDRLVVRQVTLDVNVTIDEPNPTNLSYLFLGTGVTTASAVTTPITAEVHTAAVGKAFYLNELCFDATTVVVKDSTAVTTYTLGTDYTVVQNNRSVGIVAVLGGALASAPSCKVSYTPADPAATVIAPLTTTQIQGRAKMIATSQTGNEFLWTIPSLIIAPDGEFGINDQDWTSAKLKLSIQSAGGTQPYGTVKVFGTGGLI